MNAFIKKLSIRQVASLASLTMLALALPIGLYLTAITHDIRQEAYYTPTPISPPTLPSTCQTPQPCPSGYDMFFNNPSVDEEDQCPTSYCWPNTPYQSPAPITHDDLFITNPTLTFTDLNDQSLNESQILPGQTIKYQFSADINNTIKTASLGNNFPIYLTAYLNGNKLGSTNTFYINLTNNVPNTFPLTITGQVSIANAQNSFALAVDARGSIADVNLINNSWTHTFTTATNSTFDMNGDGRINITDYTLFIAGFINGLTQ